MTQSGSVNRRSSTAFAPATVANVAVGFDVLGFALEGVGDTVTVTHDPAGKGTRIASVRGVVTDLPTDARHNTASVALQALAADRGLAGGLTLVLDKGIPLGSGMGGSAASAVAAVVAGNALLDAPLPQSELLTYALEGEKVASGAAHADNAAPCLAGGLIAVVGRNPFEMRAIPVPDGIVCVLVHPHLRVETRAARAALPREIPLALHVEQSMRLCGFLAACYTGSIEGVGRAMVDLIAEPARSGLIPGFAAARAASMRAGAVGFGIAGSGPSVFAWARSTAEAREIERCVRRAFADAGLATDGWISPISPRGAHVVPSGEST